MELGNKLYHVLATEGKVWHSTSQSIPKQLLFHREESKAAHFTTAENGKNPKCFPRGLFSLFPLNKTRQTDILSKFSSFLPRHLFKICPEDM